ncbi:MAG: DUF362 domain-containing protein [Deltaproteobacteria bacterium]|nr:DUF362 domain-containing protein [Deltaproteobacteria bacterium]
MTKDDAPPAADEPAPPSPDARPAATGSVQAASRGAPPAPGEERGLSRRDVLRVAACAGMAAGGVAFGLAIRDRNPGGRQRKLAAIRDHRVARPAGAVGMAIVRGPDAAANVTRALEALGGISAFVRRGDKVAIKPNVGWNRLPEQAANTNPDVVAQLVRMVIAAGAARVWVTDYPVNTAERCFERSGIRKAALAAGATVVMPDANNFRDIEVGGKFLRVAEALYPIVDADRVINVPLVKQHGLSGATIAMKNWYGVIGGHRVRLHQDIHRAIVELAAMVKPTLTVLDATRVLLANGPSGGSLADVKRVDTIAASTDEVALDAFGVTLLGLKAADVSFIAEAEKAGLGKADWKSLKLVEVGG